MKLPSGRQLGINPTNAGGLFFHFEVHESGVCGKFTPPPRRANAKLLKPNFSGSSNLRFNLKLRSLISKVSHIGTDNFEPTHATVASVWTSWKLAAKIHHPRLYLLKVWVIRRGRCRYVIIPIPFAGTFYKVLERLSDLQVGFLPRRRDQSPKLRQGSLIDLPRSVD